MVLRLMRILRHYYLRRRIQDDSDRQENRLLPPSSSTTAAVPLYPSLRDEHKITSLQEFPNANMGSTEYSKRTTFQYCHWVHAGTVE